jgi:hypothetical protein
LAISCCTVVLCFIVTITTKLLSAESIIVSFVLSVNVLCHSCFCFWNRETITFISTTSSIKQLLRTLSSESILELIYAMHGISYVRRPRTICWHFPGASSACYDGLSRKGYGLPPEETDPCPWSLRIGRRSTGNCAVLKKKLGDLGPLGCQIEWGFTIPGLGIHIYAMLQQ